MICRRAIDLAMTIRPRIGDRVCWFRSGKPYGGYMSGTIKKIIPDDGRGSVRLRVRAHDNCFYTVLPSDLRKEDDPIWRLKP